MRIVAIGDVHGDVDIINTYLEKSGSDIAICTGDMGMFYRTSKSSYIPKQFLSKSNFCEYLEGKKTFIKPVYTVYGVHEDHSLVRKLINRHIVINNFTVLDTGDVIENQEIKRDAIIYNKMHFSGDIVKVNNIKLGGISGSYSPNTYLKAKLMGHDRKHFAKFQIEKLKTQKIDILLCHDLIDNCSRKMINFSQETTELFDAIGCKYCIIGQYHWWGCVKLTHYPMNVISLPKAQDGYLIIETDDWRAEGVRFDLDINTGGKNDN